MYVDFLFFVALVCLAFAALAVLAHERTEIVFMTLAFRASCSVSEWALKIDENAWEAQATSDWTPGRMGMRWIRFVLWLDCKALRVTRYSQMRLDALTTCH